jgi:hypothetical protein
MGDEVIAMIYVTGDEVTATDARGDTHHATVIRGQWTDGRPGEFEKVTLRFDDGDEVPWPVASVR